MKGVHNQSVAPSPQPPQLGEVVRQHTLGNEVVGSGGVQVEHRLGSLSGDGFNAHQAALTGVIDPQQGIARLKLLCELRWGALVIVPLKSFSPLPESFSPLPRGPKKWRADT
jgi:hypothetical protein